MQSYAKAMARSRRRAEIEARRLDQERNQRDRGLGYLFLVARRHRRLNKAELARRMGASRPSVVRWEEGAQLPSVLTLEHLSAATELELVIGLRDPLDVDAYPFLALGIAHDERAVTELLLLDDYCPPPAHVPPPEWRRLLET